MQPIVGERTWYWIIVLFSVDYPGLCCQKEHQVMPEEFKTIKNGLKNDCEDMAGPQIILFFPEKHPLLKQQDFP